MATEDDDVRKLLGQMAIKDFNYRAFGRSEPAPGSEPRALHRKAESPPVNASRAPVAPTNVVEFTSKKLPGSETAVRPGSPPPPIATAFARLSRGRPASGVARLRIKLTLPLRPRVSGTKSARVERPLQEVFSSLLTASASSNSKSGPSR